MINTFIANAVCMNAYYTFGNITLHREEMDVSAVEMFGRLISPMTQWQGYATCAELLSSQRIDIATKDEDTE